MPHYFYEVQETGIQEQTPLPSRKKKIIKYILTGTGSFILFILLCAILIPVLFEGQVKKIFIRELNKNLATAVVVNEDDIDLTIFKNFPSATIVFHNVGIRESLEGSEKNFADAGEISLVFNVRDIIRGNYIIHKIILQDASINLLEDKNGNINYKFWKDSESNTHSEFEVVLEEVMCKNVRFQYKDVKAQQDIVMQVHEAAIQGNFTSELYTLQTDVKVLSEKIGLHNTNYCVNTEMHAAIQLLINNKTNTYTFKKNTIAVGKSEFAVEGSVSQHDVLNINLKVASSKSDIETIFALLPAKYARALSGIESKGNIGFDAAINGVYGKQQYPGIDINFTMKNATLYNSRFKDKLTGVNCSGSYTNGKLHTAKSSSLQVKDLKATYAGQPVSMRLSYTDFTDPYVDLQMNGNIPAAFLLPAANRRIKDASGYIAFHNVSVKGSARNLKSSTGSSPVQGNFSFHEITCTMDKETLKAVSGTAQLKDNEILLQDFKGEIFGSPVTASISLDNWLNAVFISDNSSPLYISGALSCEKVDLKKILDVFDPQEKQNEGAKTSTPSARENSIHMSGGFKCSIGNFVYGKLELKNMTADIKLSEGLIGLNNFTGNTMGGNFNLQTIFRRLGNGNYLLENIGILNNIDIQQLFTELNNFEQTTLTDKNIKGKGTAYIENASLQWDKNFKLLEDKIYVLVNIKVENGELLDYKPLASLSSFVDVNELRHIRFSTLQNQIEISNRVITIPAMLLQSSALDLYISGTHTFDNKIDYQLKLSLADLLAKKFFGKSKNKDNYESDAKGGINIYVSMTGTVDNPVIKYNKREAKQKLEETNPDKPSFIDIFKPDDEPQQKHDLFKKHGEEPASPEDTLEFIDWEEEN